MVHIPKLTRTINLSVRISAFGNWENIMKKIVFFLFVLFNCFSFGVRAETLSYIPDEPKSALIIMHGFGGNGESMSWMTNQLKKKLPHTALYYPTAPDDAPNGGYQWFVIPILGEEIKEKAIYDQMMKDALRNVPKLHELVDDIHQQLDIPYKNIHVSGFSQGGLMALLTALTNTHQIGKAVSFSGVPLLFTPDFTKEIVTHRPKILLMQGDEDTLIPQNGLILSTQTLQGLRISPHIYSIMGLNHSINHEEIEHLIYFLRD